MMVFVFSISRPSSMLFLSSQFGVGLAVATLIDAKDRPAVLLPGP